MDDGYMYLRVKRGGEMDVAIRALANGSMSATDIKKLTGFARTPYMLRLMKDWVDNLSVTVPFGAVETTGKYTVKYVDVMPKNSVKVITEGITVSAKGHANKGGDELSLQMVWPDAPPMVKKVAKFDKPLWYDTMKAMVGLGRHIALEGPPGVGKDTAVEQLAAEFGKPLVTIGGEAGFRKRDLVGSPQIASGSSYFNVSEYVAAAVNGWWVLLSEVNAADADALMYLNTQMAPPYIVTMEGKAYPVHKDFRLFVTYNHGLIGTKPLPQSFKDRFFPVKINFFSKAQLRKRLEAMGMVATAPWSERLVEFGIAMWDAHMRGQMRYQITTRRLNDVVCLMSQDVGKSYTLKDAILDAVVAAIDNPAEQIAAKRVLDDVKANEFSAAFSA